MVLYVQNVQNILLKWLLYTEVTDRLPWRSTCLRGNMAQHAIFFPRLQINSKILYYRPFVTCHPLPRFTHS